MPLLAASKQAAKVTERSRKSQANRRYDAAAERAGSSLRTTELVLAQVWRHGSKQARLASFLKSVTMHAFEDGRSVGRMLAQTDSADIVDAHLVTCALRLGHDILTGDPDDFAALASPLIPAAPMIHAWP